MKRSNLGLVYLAVILIAALLASCSTTNAVYKVSETKWKNLPEKSSLTGWKYDK